MRDSYKLYQDKLQGEYGEAFKQINLYFSTQQVDDDTEEEYMGALLDAFLLAQEEGKPVEKITGKNLENFCKSFCSNLTWQQKILRLLDQLKSLAWFTFFIPFIELFFSLEDIISGKVNPFEIVAEANVFGYIVGFGIAMIVSSITDYMTKVLMFRLKKISMRVWEMIVAVVSIAVFIMWLVLFFGEREIDLPAWSVCLISGVYLALYYIFNRNRIVERKAHEVKFWDEVKKDTEFVPNTDNVFSQEMEKKWEKKNAKRLKKGLPAFTREEVLALEEADIIKSEENKWAIWFFPIIITAGIVIFGEFETPADMYWFAGIMLAVEYVLMALLWKAAKSSNINMRKWIEAERKKLEQADDVEEK